ncbi:MAG TPA: conjugative transfer relaxase/helicase TraI domain-containing protein [Arsenophonus sp.]
MKQLEKRLVERLTAYDILSKQEDQLALNAVRKWENSQEIRNTKLAQKIDQSLVEVARFSHHGLSAFLLPVINKHGIHRGNLHIPVGVYTGKTDIKEATYKGASNGIYVVLNKDNDENSINLYSLSQFDEALKNDAQDNSIIIELDSHNQHDGLENLHCNPEKNIDNTDTILESALLHDDEKIIDTAQDKEAELQKENDEINISHHHEDEQKQKIKEKEYGD